MVSRGKHRLLRPCALVYLVKVFIAEQMDLSRLEAVLAFALVEDVRLELPARTLSGGHNWSGQLTCALSVLPLPKNLTAQFCR